jgi:ferredoxin
MPAKYHVKIKSAPPRFSPVSKFCVIEVDGCLGCLECVKRESCIYDVYRNRQFDPVQVVDSADVMCISCMRCVQECKKNILSRIRNPQFERLGDDYWKGELIASIWAQSDDGSIPVSGAGYHGPFAGPGFDQMWTDMSEIVRPTRDGIHGREYISTVIELGRRPGIHGREYISTVIELGRRPSRLQFDEKGKLITRMYPFVEIPVPIVLDMPECSFATASTRDAVFEAAGALETFAVASATDVGNALHRPGAAAILLPGSILPVTTRSCWMGSALLNLLIHKMLLKMSKR